MALGRVCCHPLSGGSQRGLFASAVRRAYGRMQRIASRVIGAIIRDVCAPDFSEGVTPLMLPGSL